MKELREENLQFNERIKALAKENQALESQLVDAKVHWADLDMENDLLACKLH